jgi:hypothetical protein
MFDSTLSWEATYCIYVIIKSANSTMGVSTFTSPSKMFDMNIKMYYSLIYPLQSCGTLHGDRGTWKD